MQSDPSLFGGPVYDYNLKGFRQSYIWDEDSKALLIPPSHAKADQAYAMTVASQQKIRDLMNATCRIFHPVTSVTGISISIGAVAGIVSVHHLKWDKIRQVDPFYRHFHVSFRDSCSPLFQRFHMEQCQGCVEVLPELGDSGIDYCWFRPRTTVPCALSFTDAAMLYEWATVKEVNDLAQQMKAAFSAGGPSVPSSSPSSSSSSSVAAPSALTPPASVRSLVPTLRSSPRRLAFDKILADVSRKFVADVSKFHAEHKDLLGLPVAIIGYNGQPTADDLRGLRREIPEDERIKLPEVSVELATECLMADYRSVAPGYVTRSDVTGEFYVRATTYYGCCGGLVVTLGDGKVLGRVLGGGPKEEQSARNDNRCGLWAVAVSHMALYDKHPKV